MLKARLCFPFYAGVLNTVGTFCLENRDRATPEKHALSQRVLMLTALSYWESVSASQDKTSFP